MHKTTKTSDMFKRQENRGDLRYGTKANMALALEGNSAIGRDTGSFTAAVSRDILQMIHHVPCEVYEPPFCFSLRVFCPEGW